MRRSCTVIHFLLCALLLTACKKEEAATATAGCFPGTPTVRNITNQPAAIRAAGSRFFIIEQGTIDTRLEPCNLPGEFQVNNLQVTISGEVKLTMQVGPGPCCTEDFVLTKISR